MSNDGQHVDLAALQELKSVMEGEFGLLIDTFLNDSAQRIQALTGAIAAGNAEMVRATAHSFKGSASNLGASNLTELCRELEDMGRAGVLSSAPSLFTSIKIEYDAVQNILRRMMK